MSILRGGSPNGFFERKEKKKEERGQAYFTTSSELVKHIADIFDVKEESITKNPKGRRASNSARAFAMYASQEYGDMSLKEIAEAFDLGHTGSTSFSINKTRKEIAKGKWSSKDSKSVCML